MLDLAAWAADRIADIEGLELATATDLTVVSFRSLRGDDETRRIFAGINAAREAHLSSTTVGGIFTIRLVLLSQRTTRDQVEQVIRRIEALVSAD